MKEMIETTTENKLNIEKFGAYMKVSKEVTLGHVDDDFIREQLTAALYAKVAAMHREEGIIHFSMPPQSFWDWLFRRPQNRSIPYTIRELVKIDKLKFDDNIRVINFDL